MNIPLKRENLPFLFIFFFQGAFYTHVTSPLPAIKEASSLTESQIGMEFLCVGIGMLLGLALLGKIASRIESKKALMWAGLGMLLWGPCLALGFSASIRNVLAVLFGVFLGLYEGFRNVQAILHERQCGRNVMGMLYAGNDLGSIAGCLMTSFLMGYLGLSLFTRLSLFSILFGLAGLFVYRYLISDSASGSASDESQPEETKPSKSKLPVIVFLMGVMLLGQMDFEATIGDWGSILMQQSKGASESLSALPFAATSLGMTISSLSCDWVRGRIGACCTVAFGMLLAWGGLIFAVYVPSPAMSLLGFFFVGIGLAPVPPILTSAVGSLPDVNIAQASAAVAWIGNAGFLLLPGAKGFLAEHLSIEAVFLSCILISLATLLGSFALKGKG